MTAIRPRAHLDSGEGATDHALLNPEVQTRTGRSWWDRGHAEEKSLAIYRDLALADVFW